MVDYYDKVFLESYIEAKSAVSLESIKNLPEPERSMALYAYLKDNDRGTAWESIVAEESGFLTKVPSTEGRGGDLKNLLQNYFEFKISYSDKKGDYSFWQCRPWEPLDGYFFKVIDRSNGWKHSDYFLTKEQFLHELSICKKLDMSHGRKKDLPGPLTVETAIEWRVELTFRLKIKGKEQLRSENFKNKYLTEDIYNKLR